MAVGSGDLLLGATHMVKNPKTLKLFGFDIEKSAIAKSASVLKGFNYVARLQDSLNLLKDKTNLYDISILNPPWNLSIGQYFKIFPAKGKILYQDWIWMLVASNIAKRKSVVIESQSVLSRIKGEFQLRKKIIELNIIESIIILPNDSFENAKLYSVIIIFNKNKKDDKVLFVDGTKINKTEIIDIVLNKKEIKNISTLAAIKQIKENNYNINPHVYLFMQNSGERIKDVFNIFTNGKKPKTYDKGGRGRLPWIRITDVKNYDGTFIKKPLCFIKKDEVICKRVRAAPKNSLILTGRASIGKIAITNEKSSFDRGCIALVPKNKNLDIKKYIEPIRKAAIVSKTSMPGTIYKSLAKKYIENLFINVS